MKLLRHEDGRWDLRLPIGTALVLLLVWTVQSGASWTVKVDRAAIVALENRTRVVELDKEQQAIRRDMVELKALLQESNRLNRVLIDKMGEARR